jgi:hypothetical protein
MYVHGREWLVNAYQLAVSDKMYISTDIGTSPGSIYADRDGTLNVSSTGRIDLSADPCVRVNGSYVLTEQNQRKTYEGFLTVRVARPKFTHDVVTSSTVNDLDTGLFVTWDYSDQFVNVSDTSDTLDIKLEPDVGPEVSREVERYYKNRSGVAGTHANPSVLERYVVALIGEDILDELDPWKTAWRQADDVVFVLDWTPDTNKFDQINSPEIVEVACRTSSIGGYTYSSDIIDIMEAQNGVDPTYIVFRVLSPRPVSPASLCNVYMYSQSNPDLQSPLVPPNANLPSNTTWSLLQADLNTLLGASFSWNSAVPQQSNLLLPLYPITYLSEESWCNTATNPRADPDDVAANPVHSILVYTPSTQVTEPSTGQLVARKVYGIQTDVVPALDEPLAPISSIDSTGKTFIPWAPISALSGPNRYDPYIDMGDPSSYSIYGGSPNSVNITPYPWLESEYGTSFLNLLGGSSVTAIHASQWVSSRFVKDVPRAVDCGKMADRALTWDSAYGSGATYIPLYPYQQARFQRQISLMAAEYYAHHTPWFEFEYTGNDVPLNPDPNGRVLNSVDGNKYPLDIWDNLPYLQDGAEFSRPNKNTDPRILFDGRPKKRLPASSFSDHFNTTGEGKGMVGMFGALPPTSVEYTGVLGHLSMTLGHALVESYYSQTFAPSGDLTTYSSYSAHPSRDVSYSPTLVTRIRIRITTN